MTMDTDRGIELFAGIELKLGNISRALEQANELSRRGETPRFIRIHGVCTTDGSGNGMVQFDLNGPDQGWYWSVRRLGVFQAASAAAAAGVADVFVSASNQGSPSLMDWVDRAPNIPLFADYNDNELICRHNEELIVTFTGAPATTQMLCTGFIVAYQEAAYPQRFAL